MVGVLALTMLESDYFWIANALYLSFVVGTLVGSWSSSSPTAGASNDGQADQGDQPHPGAAVRRRRDDAGRARRQVGVTRQTIIAIEQGRYSPSLEMAFQIARVFGVPLDEVFQYPQEG